MVEESGEPTFLARAADNAIVQFVMKLAVSSVPVAGGAASMALGDYFSKRERDRFQKLIDELQARMAGLERKLNEDAIAREDLPDVLQEVIMQYVRTGDEVRQDYLAGFLVSAMTETAEEHERDFFLRKIREFSTVHLELLRLARDPIKALELKGMNPESVNRAGLKDLVRVYLPGTDLALIQAAHRELHALRFFSTDGDIYGVMMSSTGIQSFSGALTPLGKRFVDACQQLRAFK